MFEFQEIVECPHCGDRAHQCVAFDAEMDPVLCETQCNGCDEIYWFKGHARIDVDDTYAKKPTPKKGKKKKND